jgi:magnesium-transporting ATPase (P-type)
MSDPSMKNDYDDKIPIKKGTLTELFYTTDIKILQGIPFLVSIAIVFLYPLLLYMILDKEKFQNYNASGLLPVAFFILSLSGIVAILRKEFYWTPFLTLKGSWAIFWGIFFTISCLLVGVLLIIL